MCLSYAHYPFKTFILLGIFAIFTQTRLNRIKTLKLKLNFELSDKINMITAKSGLLLNKFMMLKNHFALLKDKFKLLKDNFRLEDKVNCLKDNCKLLLNKIRLLMNNLFKLLSDFIILIANKFKALIKSLLEFLISTKNKSKLLLKQLPNVLILIKNKLKLLANITVLMKNEVKLLKGRIKALRQKYNFTFKIKYRHKQRIINTCYFSAVFIAFVLSLAHNNRVEASIDNQDYFSYLIVEDSINQNIEGESIDVVDETSNSIKEMFDMVDNLLKSKNEEKELTLESGDTLISLLKKAGATREIANDIYYSLKEHYDPRNLKAGQKIKINVAIDNQSQEVKDINYLMIEQNAGERIITANNNGVFETHIEKQEFIDEINSVSGIIDGNLSSVMNKKGIPMRVVSNFINLFSYSVDFKRDIKKGDRFEIVYESQIIPDGTLVKSGNIIYAGLILKNQKIGLYRFKDSNGKVDYYTDKGRALKKILDRKPLANKNARISSPFGKRFHPVLKKYKIHWGVDYAAASGTPIYAGGDGVVQVAKYNGSYGNYIKIRHNSEFSTAYGHMSRFAQGIRPGVRVTQGQIIAYVGSTGRSTGPHLHYEVIQNGRRVNPRTIKASTGENLSGNNLKNFDKLVAKIDRDFGKDFAKAKDIKVAKK
ncbi:MAG: hypothetical protein E7004_00565 [Alphaproteobacteria bacterium]|nr:hypothetical protein [Alphaproteobacteria bacterium]